MREAIRIHKCALETLANKAKNVQASLKAFYEATVYLQSIERQARLAVQSFTSNQLELVRKSLLDLNMYYNC
jgi:hypothetical protein